MAHATMVDTAVNTDSWLMESVHKEEAGSRQQDAGTEARFEHKHGSEIVAILSRHKAFYTESLWRATMFYCHSSRCIKKKCQCHPRYNGSLA